MNRKRIYLVKDQTTFWFPILNALSLGIIESQFCVCLERLTISKVKHYFIFKKVFTNIFEFLEKVENEECYIRSFLEPIKSLFEH